MKIFIVAYLLLTVGVSYHQQCQRACKNVEK